MLFFHYRCKNYIYSGLYLFQIVFVFSHLNRKKNKNLVIRWQGHWLFVKREKGVAILYLIQTY